MKKRVHKADSFEAIHASAKALHNAGEIDSPTMRNFDEAYLFPALKFSTCRIDGEKKLFDNYKICQSLNATHTCIVVEQYCEGEMIVKFHEHVPYRRLSSDDRGNLLKTLMINFSRIDPNSFVKYYVNNGGKNPTAADINWTVSYPEAGVIRTSCGTNTRAWSDQIVDKSKFRQKIQK
jgi:hypothetical protein